MNIAIRIHPAPRTPSQPGMGLEPPYLADRRDQLERFRQFLDGFPDFPRNLRLTGLGGVGKTVLLQRYAGVAVEHGWVVISGEWSERLRDERAFALALVADCRQAAEQTARTRRLKAAVAPLRHVIRAVGMSNGAAQRLMSPFTDKGLVHRPERGVIAFAVPLFGEYLRRTARLEAS